MRVKIAYWHLLGFCVVQTVKVNVYYRWYSDRIPLYHPSELSDSLESVSSNCELFKQLWFSSWHAEEQNCPRLLHGHALRPLSHKQAPLHKQTVMCLALTLSHPSRIVRYPLE